MAPAAVLAVLIGLSGCSAPLAKDATPEEKIGEARRSMDKRHYEDALATLEQIRDITAGTKLGGEVLFLMAQSKFATGKFAEADGLGETYLSLYPAGPYAQEALFLRGRSNLRMVQKTRLGFFSLQPYIPHDRDRTPLTRARELFTLYLAKYPDGQRAAEATEAAGLLADKEAEHELEVASFYLKRGRAQAALSRANAVLASGCSELVRTAAGVIADRARAASSEATAKETP